MKKSILITVQDMRGGGAEKMMARLATALAEAGHDVTLLMLTDGGVNTKYLSPQVKRVELGCSRTFASIPALTRFLRNNRFDAHLAALTHVNVVAIIAATLSGSLKTLHVSERNAFSLDKHVNQSAQLKLAYWLAPLLYHVIPNPVICVSRGVAQDLVDTTVVSQKDVTTADNPVLDNDFRDKTLAAPSHAWLLERTTPVIVAVGRLAPQKGFDTLLNAMAQLHNTQARLVIFGEGELRTALTEQIQRLGLSDRVDLAGYNADPLAQVAASSCFVLSSRFEGSPNALVEAMSTGVPVVSTNCPYGPDGILNQGTVAPLVPVDDPKALAQAIDAELDKAPQLARDGRLAAAERFKSATAALTYMAAFFPNGARGGAQ